LIRIQRTEGKGKELTGDLGFWRARGDGVTDGELLVVSRGNGGVNRMQDVEGSSHAWPRWLGASCSDGEVWLKEARMSVTFGSR
jgi:hypothetical protein